MVCILVFFSFMWMSGSMIPRMLFNFYGSLKIIAMSPSGRQTTQFTCLIDETSLLGEWDRLYISLRVIVLLCFVYRFESYWHVCLLLLSTLLYIDKGNLFAWGLHWCLIKNCLFQWSPDKSSVFGSSAEDGILNIWDHERVRDPYLLISFSSFLFLADYMLRKFF